MDREPLAIIQEIIAEEMDISPQEDREDMNLKEDLEMDETSITQLLMACEAEFGVEYELQDMWQIKTVEDVVNSVTEW